MCLLCEKKRTVVVCDLCIEPFSWGRNAKPVFHVYVEYMHLMGMHMVLDHGLFRWQIDQLKRDKGHQGSGDRFTVPSLDGGWRIVATGWKPSPDYEPGQEYRRA